MRALFTTWEGGGHVPAALLVAGQLQARGAEVLLLSDEANRGAALTAGLPFRAWRRAPNRQTQGAVSDPLRDWRARTPPGVIKAICDGVMCRPASDYAQDTLELIERFRPDVVVSNELLFGVMAAAEASARPLVLLTGNLWCFPTREDVPPFGPGFAPGRGELGKGRDRTVRSLIARWFDQGLADLNGARGVLGLDPLPHVLEQLDVASLILLGTAQAFDFGGPVVPAPFVYAGPLIGGPAWVRPLSAPLSSPVGDQHDPPLVLISFSTVFQDQAAVVARCMRALAGAPVRGLVTLGPAIDPGRMPRVDNVEVVQSAPHDQIVPRCAAVICHAGHGTALRPLMHGVPLLCLPSGRDQPENAIRIVERGAGLKLSPRASAWQIRRAAMRLIEAPQYRSAAARLGAAILGEADGGLRAAERIQMLGSGRSTPIPEPAQA